MTPQQLKWIEALESGDYPQGTGNLKKDGTYCCLGVACQIFKDELGIKEDVIGTLSVFDNQSCALPPEKVVTHLGLLCRYGGGKDKQPSLVNLNDSNMSFEEIAQLLRKGDYCDTPAN